MDRKQFKRVWGKPLLLAVITVFGLVAALSGTGIRHLFSWLAMAVILLVILQKIYAAKRKA